MMQRKQPIARLNLVPHAVAVGLKLLAAAFFCLASPRPAQAAPAVFVLGDMEKPTGEETVVDSPVFFRDGTVHLHGAGNETVAFQVVLRASSREAGLDARLGDLAGPANLAARPNIQLFRAHYIGSRDASYSWGPGGAGALPWRGRLWPDALLPLRDPYDAAGAPVAAPFAIDPATHPNQSLWVDIFIPPGQAPGRYRGRLDLLQGGTPFKTLPVELDVHPFSLPAETHVDAFGELYRETGVMFDSGVKFKDDPQRDWAVTRRYLQMAHAHRFLAVPRAADGPLPQTLSGKRADSPYDYWCRDLGAYTTYVGPVLDGSLFTAQEGYAGPSPGTPPAFFPAPFVETFYGAGQYRDHLREHGGQVDPKWLNVLQDNAATFREEADRRGWGKVRFFAYILDEVDGAQDTGENRGEALAEAALFHRGMRQIQQALDEGAGGRRIHLLWTSHADAARWAGTAADLAGTVSWWAPNGHALNVDFYRERVRGAETVWFYHSGQPAIGNHTINQTGIDLRLWGLLCWRYGVQGSFWWSMMCFPRGWNDPDFNPYAMPNYKEDDTRWGNGVLFYPGTRLTRIGCARNIDGPVSSLRMKAYRRGLQDVEYLWLTKRKGQDGQAQALLKKLIPAAFSEAPRGDSPGAWSKNVEDYYRLRSDLARLIGEFK